MKIGLQGPAGSGKTLSALYLARGMTGGNMSRVAVLDTENSSALYYADRKDTGEGWLHIPFSPPYSPERYIEAIRYAESQPIDVLIIDSMSHEWDGKGGCLEIHQRFCEASKGGNSFAAWAKVTPKHNTFVDCIRESRLHIIGTTRAKQDYVLEENDKGRQIPKKVGLKGIQREGFDYELGLMFDVGMSHYATTSKDRTGLFMPRDAFMITEETGQELMKWAESGEMIGYDSKVEAHKFMLLSVLRDANVTDRDKMKAISDAFSGKPLDQMREFVFNFQNNGETK